MNTIDPAAYNGDIVSRLRNWRGLHLAHSGDLFEEAADEIAQLRLTDEIAQVRLTDEEREAVASCIADDEAATAYERADTLRSLLSRTGSDCLKTSKIAVEVVDKDENNPERERIRLTDAERLAVDAAAHAFACLYVGPEGVTVTATLRTLLARAE